MALIATSIEKFATEIRGLQKSETREVEEFFAKGQKGSSAMPHKRNPIGSENMAGLARVVRDDFDRLHAESLWQYRQKSDRFPREYEAQYECDLWIDLQPTGDVEIDRSRNDQRASL